MQVETPSEQLFFTTTLLTAKALDGSGWTGTGFVHAVNTDHGVVHLLVTNKHVLADANQIALQFVRAEGGRPAYGQRAAITLTDFDQTVWFGHPDAEIDVAVLPLGAAFIGLMAAGQQPFFRALPESLIPDGAAIASLDAVERVTFIGYPAGLYDSANLTPIARQGYTATPIALDYEGLPQFVIDAAVFPGSSGSPVFLYDRGMIVDRAGNVTIGSRLYLLGVLAAVHRDEVEARVSRVARRLVARFDQLLGLGIVFKTQTIGTCVDLVLHKHGFTRIAAEVAPAPQTAPPNGSGADQEIAGQA